MGDGNTRRCPDDGACHHGCGQKCWRVRWAGPFSGTYPDDRWPDDIVAANPPDTGTEPDDDFTAGLLGNVRASGPDMVAGKSAAQGAILPLGVLQMLQDLVPPGTEVIIMDLKQGAIAPWPEGDPAGPEDDDRGPCDAEAWGASPSWADGSCRCLVCGRCGHHTGNSHYGHYSYGCRVLLARIREQKLAGQLSMGETVARAVRDKPHFCCPDPAFGCEAETGPGALDGCGHPAAGTGEQGR